MTAIFVRRYGAAAAHYLGGNEALIQEIKHNFEASPVSNKLKSLFAIAGKVQKGAKEVTSEDIQRARQEGASDMEIHDTVLIAAAFCMYNRYVDGLATWAPTDLDGFRERAAKVARDGYLGVLGYIAEARAGGSGA